MMENLMIVQTKNKPIKYFIHTTYVDNNRLNVYSSPTQKEQSIKKYIEQKNEENCNSNIKQVYKIKLKYEETLFPHLELKKIVIFYNSVTNIIFRVKQHSRILPPYKHIKFLIPSILFQVNDIFNQYVTVKVFLENVEENTLVHNMVEKTGKVPWVYGNVYSSNGVVCWGEKNIESLKNIILYLINSDDGEQTNKTIDVYLNMYMQYIYSEFFTSVFNKDLQEISLFYLLDITDKLTVKATTAVLLEEYPRYKDFNNNNIVTYIIKNNILLPKANQMLIKIDQMLANYKNGGE